MAEPAPPTALHMGKGKVASVVAVLGERIVAGDYAPDAPLPVEADLAQSLDVGRSVLREAVKVLAAKGMVLARPRVGTVILPREEWNLFDHDVLLWHLRAMPLQPDLLRDILEARRIIEPEAALLAALNGSPARKQAIADHYHDMVTGARDPEAAVKADIGFHIAVLMASGNAILIAFAPALTAILTAFFKISIQKPEMFPGNLPAHEEVSQRILAGDPAGARAAMLRVLAYTETDLLDRAAAGDPDELLQTRRNYP